jgi:hypothetical protein
MGLRRSEGPTWTARTAHGPVEAFHVACGHIGRMIGQDRRGIVRCDPTRFGSYPVTDSYPSRRQTLNFHARLGGPKQTLAYAMGNFGNWVTRKSPRQPYDERG